MKLIGIEVFILAFANASFYLSFYASDWISFLFHGLIQIICVLGLLMIYDIYRHNPAQSHTVKSLLLQYAALRAIRLIGAKCHKRITQATENVQKTQKNVLASILEKNRSTEFGLKHGFGCIKSREENKRACPLTTYEDYEKYISRIERGEERLLTKDPVVFLATSSGTTGRNKHIPITKAFKEAGQEVAMTVYHMLDVKCGLDLQRTAMLRYKPNITHSQSGITIAPVTYHLSKHLPFYVTPKCVHEINNEQSALFVHAVFLLAESEIGYIDALMATLLYSFWILVENRWKKICNVIERGQFEGRVIEIDEGLRMEIEKHLTPNKGKEVIDIKFMMSNILSSISRTLKE